MNSTTSHAALAVDLLLYTAECLDASDTEPSVAGQIDGLTPAQLLALCADEQRGLAEDEGVEPYSDTAESLAQEYLADAGGDARAAHAAAAEDAR